MICETPDDRRAIADYISDLTAELAVMAAWAEHIDLARILEMARLESERLCGRGPSDAPAVADDAASHATDDIAANDTGPAQAAPHRSEANNVILLSTLRAARR